MYIDNIGEQLIIGSTQCADGLTGPTGVDGTHYFTNYYEIESVNTPLKGPAGLSQFILGEYIGFTIDPNPSILFYKNYYNVITIVTTGLINFQPWDDILEGYDAGTPSIPSLFINAHKDNSTQRIYYGYEENHTKLRFRIEGTNAPTGVIGEPNIIWELTYYFNTPGQIDIVFGEITPPIDGSETLTAMSTGQGFLGQLNAISNTAYRIKPAQKLVSSINIKGDGFRTGVKDDILYVDVEPLYPLTLTTDYYNSVTTIASPTQLDIESSSWLRLSAYGGLDIHTQQYSDTLDPNYYGNVSITPGANESVPGLTFLNNVWLQNVPQYNSNSIPTGPEYLVWYDENNFLRVL